MTKTRKIIVELLDTLVYAVIFYALFSVAVYMTSFEYISFLQTGYFAALVAANFCMRRVCFANLFRRNKTVVTLLGLKLAIAHLIIQVVVIAILPFSAMGMVWFAFSLAMSLHSIWYARRIFPPRRSVIWTAAVIFILISIWMAIEGNWFFVSVYTLLTLFVAIARLIVIHIINVDSSLKAAESSSQPIRKIIAFNYKLLAGFVLVFSGVVAAVYFALIRPVLLAVVTAIGRLPGLEQHVEQITRDEYLGPIFRRGFTDIDDITLLLLFWNHINPAHTNYAAYLIVNILLGAMVIALVLGIGYIVLRIIFRFMNMRAKTGIHKPLSKFEDEKEFISPNRTRRSKRAKVKNEHALRRLFRETIQKHIKMGIPIKNTDTPTEMTVRVRDRDFDSLADEYSRVRYGEE